MICQSQMIEITFLYYEMPHKKYDEFSVYVYSTGINEVYFDDLKIEKIAG